MIGYIIAFVAGFSACAFFGAFLLAGSDDHRLANAEPHEQPAETPDEAKSDDYTMFEEFPKTEWSLEETEHKYILTDKPGSTVHIACDKELPNAERCALPKGHAGECRHIE